MILKITEAFDKDVYRDTARIPHKYREYKNGKVIIEGTICKVTHNNKSIYLIIRGDLSSDESVIRIDERTRNALDVNINDKLDFTIIPCGIFGKLHWLWNASDTTYRLASKLAILSVILGLIGFILGIISIYISC